MSHCQTDCSAAWPAFKAPADASTGGAWSVITREDGSQQWAYHDKPLYTYSKDKPGQPGQGEAVAPFKFARR
jgi:predicted lipoprotein with Yx(FWY)xxD motif